MSKSVLTPLCDKLAEASAERDAVLEFFEWLDKQMYQLAIWGDHGDLRPERKTVETLYLEFLGIDPTALDKERRALIAAQRELNKKRE